MIEPTDLDWLALCLCTESNRPEEWPYIAQVIENRRRTRRWGDTYKSVVLARKQFSAFDLFTEPHGDPHLGTCGMLVAMLRREDTLSLMRAAMMCQAKITEADETGREPGWELGITRTTLHYYSPVSMKPPGAKPAWAASAKRLYTPRGISPDRFVFAEGVA